jgi:hypothetical protein
MDETTQVEVDEENDEQEKYRGGEIPRVEPPIEPDAPSRAEPLPEPQPDRNE